MIDLNYLCLFEHVLLQCNVLPCYCSVMFFNQLLQIYKYIVQHWPIRKPIWCITRLIKQLSTPANTEESQKRCQLTRSVANRLASTIDVPRSTQSFCVVLLLVNLLLHHQPLMSHEASSYSAKTFSTHSDNMTKPFKAPFLDNMRRQGLPKWSFSNLLVGNSVFPTDAEDLP
jgi:hypothetical protein